MTLNINRTSLAELQNADATKLDSISIETFMEKEKLATVQSLIDANDQIKLVLVIDPGVSREGSRLYNMEIIGALNSLKQVAVLSFGDDRLDDLSELGSQSDLISFSLQGNYKKDIKLPTACTSIKDLELEYGLAGKQQPSFMNTLKNLRTLKVSVLDLALIRPSEQLESLVVTNSLKAPALLTERFPALNSFCLYYGKGTDSFDFIAGLEHLSSLTLGYTTKLTRLPNFDHPKSIKELSLLATANFSDMDSILQFENLEQLIINEPVKANLEDIRTLAALSKLKKVEIAFSQEEHDEGFRRIKKENNWI